MASTVMVSINCEMSAGFSKTMSTPDSAKITAETKLLRQNHRSQEIAESPWGFSLKKALININRVA